MRNIEFVNRTEDLRFLLEKVEQLSEINQILLIKAGNGIGKSSLTKKLSENVEYPFIKVEIQQNRGKGYADGYYLRKIGKAIDHASKDQRIDSLNGYLKTIKSSVLNRRLLQSVIDESRGFKGASILKEVAERATGQGVFSADNLFNSNHNDSLTIIEDYVTRQLLKSPLILNIENIQDIDDSSYVSLLNILNKTLGNLFLWEYTESVASALTISDFIDDYSALRKTDIDIYELSPLNLNEVKKIFDQYPELSWDMIQNSFTSYNGNLRPVRDIFAMVKHFGSKGPNGSTSNLSFSNASDKHLSLLSKSQQFLLTIISVHEEPVDKSLLFLLGKFKECFSLILDVRSVLSFLEKQDLIKLKGEFIEIYDDSINGKILEFNTNNIFLEIAYKFWLGVYDGLLEPDDIFTSRSIRLQRTLLFASLLNQQSRIISLLDEIKNEVLLSRSPKKMISYVEVVRDKLLINPNNDAQLKTSQINFWLVELYLSLGASDQALPLIDSLQTTLYTKNVLKGIVYEQIGKQTDAITLVNTALLDLNAITNPNYELALRLIRLVSLYDIGLYENAKNEFFKLYYEEKYTELVEYGFLLRNAELIFSYKDSLPYYLESIKLFEKFGAVQQTAFSRIAYGVHLAILGKLELADIEFNAAGVELSGTVSESSTLLNNQAVVLLFKKQLGEETEELLRYALINAESDFSRVTILINYMVLMDWRESDEEVEKTILLIEDVLKKPSFASKEIIRYAYFDIYKYYQRKFEIEACVLYLNKISELGLEETPIWKFWLYDDPIPLDDEEFFRSTIDRAISYLTHWNMDFDSKLMRYE